MAPTVDDMVVLVTGGTGALGSVVTKQFLAEGSTVVTTYLESEEYEELQAAVGEDAALTGYKVDVTAEEQVESLVEKVIEEHGRIDVLLNIVGAWKGGNPIHDTDEDTWDFMMDVNLKSAFLVSKHVLPHMREHGFGRVISMGSKTGHELPENGGPYAVAKRGVESLTQLMARENADDGITVNCILPSVIDTEANRESMGTDNRDKWVGPGEIAEKMLTLIQDGQNAATVKVYGGYEDRE